jgi:hypothetical protein
MQPIRPGLKQGTEQSNAERQRAEAQRFVAALASRLSELETMAQQAHRFQVFSAAAYADFKQLFLCFSGLCEEFQVLSQLAESSLSGIGQRDRRDRRPISTLHGTYRELQAPMLRAMIRTNLRLLKVWDDRMRSGEGLPLGAGELFRETVRVIDRARHELLRPRTLALLDPEAIEEAAEANRLLKRLMDKTPSLFTFVDSPSIDDELMILINGLPRSP